MSDEAHSRPVDVPIAGGGVARRLVIAENDEGFESTVADVCPWDPPKTIATAGRISPMGTGTSAPRSPRAAPDSNADERLLLRDGTVVWLRTMDRDHEASGERAGIAADVVDGRRVGHVCYRRVYGLRAEMKLEVDDAYWHRGVPELLLASLCVRATCTGISTFLARVPARDGRLRTLLHDEFAARESCDGSDGTYVQIELSATALPPSGRTTDHDGRP